MADQATLPQESLDGSWAKQCSESPAMTRTRTSSLDLTIIIALVWAACTAGCSDKEPSSSASMPSPAPESTTEIVIPAGTDLFDPGSPDTRSSTSVMELPELDGKAILLYRSSDEVVGVFKDDPNQQIFAGSSTETEEAVLRPVLGQLFLATEGTTIVIPAEASHLHFARASGGAQSLSVQVAVIDAPPQAASASITSLQLVRYINSQYVPVEVSELQHGDSFQIEVRYDVEPSGNERLVRLDWDDEAGEQVVVYKSFLDWTVFRSDVITIETPREEP